MISLYVIGVLTTCEVICATPVVRGSHKRHGLSRNQAAFLLTSCCALWPAMWALGGYLVWKGKI